VVEGARLESVCRGNSTEGSNPSLSDPSLRSGFGSNGLQAIALVPPKRRRTAPAATRHESLSLQ
jgi:hypothetical protein